MPDAPEALTPQQRKLVAILETRAKQIVTEACEAVRKTVRADLDGITENVDRRLNPIEEALK